MEGSDPEMEEIDFLGRYGTIEVLEYVGDHPQCKKEDLTRLVDSITVAELIEILQKTGLVGEELTLTDKGRNLLKCFENIRNMLEG